MLITCPECTKQISDSVSNCPNCGYQLTAERVATIKKVEKGFAIVCLAVLVVFLIIFLIDIFSSKSPNNNSSVSATSSEKSVWEQNQDFARELDRMEKARQLDRIEEERRAIDKYRQ